MEIIIAGIIAFASTNLDDIFILTLFYGDKRFNNKEILIGQLFGISTLIGISLITSLAGLFINPAYIGLLGLFPIYLGIKGIRKCFKKEDEEKQILKINKSRNNSLVVAGVTMANGGDNIGIYVPLFITLTCVDRTIIVLVFLIMTIIWCLIAQYLTKRPYVAKGIEKYGHIVTPYVLIVLGIFILKKSETFTLLLK